MNQRAFTIMELMIVVIIIGVMASFAIPRFNTAVEQSHQDDANAQLIALHGANRIYLAQAGEYLPGNALTLADINTNLDINLMANGMTFSYTRNTATTYTATAVRDAPAATFTITLTEAPLEAGVNPDCTAGTCPY